MSTGTDSPGGRQERRKLFYKSLTRVIEITGNERKVKMLFIRDNWTGFAMQHAHKLFPGFQRVHGREEFKCTGVDAIRRFIRNYDNHMWIEMIQGSGAIFHSTLIEEGKP